MTGQAPEYGWVLSYRHYVVMAPLCAALAGYPVVPPGLAREVAYCLIGLVCLVTALVGVLRHISVRRKAWLLIFGGFLGWVAGDFVYLFEQRILHMAAYPAPSDAVYVASYVLLGAGLLMVARRRGDRGDLAALLDAAILAVGAAVVVGAFFIAPIADDSSLSALGKMTASLYPIADVALLGILVRLWTAPGARTPAFRLLAAALGVTLLADLTYNVTVITSASAVTWVVSDLLWLASYVLVAGAVWAPAASELTEPAPGRDELADPSRHLVLLTCGLLLPAGTLLVDGLTGDKVQWEVIATGSALLALLVLARMAGLLTVVRAQAVQLSALARSDPLTGLPNRRTWDYELSRACRQARERAAPLTVALLDLDHFKDYNDAHGHPAGDLLLREAAAAWTDLLREGEVIARYGGEEFAVLFPGLTAAEATARVHDLMRHTPSRQTFSAGVATWDPISEPASALAAADVGLYAAKRAGRRRVFVAPDRNDMAGLPELDDRVSTRLGSGDHRADGS